MGSVKTTKIGGGADYALVPDRLKEFREANPRAKIETVPKWRDDGGLEFRAYIIKDKADENSADATGNAFYTSKEMTPKKSYEKLETIAVGRALALLGYLNNGKIATSEEMVEFEEYQNNKKFEAIENAIEQINSTKTMDELKALFNSLGTLKRETEVFNAKEAQKLKLSKGNEK